MWFRRHRFLFNMKESMGKTPVPGLLTWVLEVHFHPGCYNPRTASVFSLLLTVICLTQWGHIYIQKSKWLPIVPHPGITQCPIPNSSFFGTSFFVNNSFHHGCCAVDSFLIWINFSVIGISTNLWVIAHIVSSAYSEIMNLLKWLLKPLQ